MAKRTRDDERSTTYRRTRDEPKAGGERRTALSGEDRDFFLTMRERYEAAADVERENRTEALLDQKFRAGYQWDEADTKERAAKKRPVITVNRIPQFLKQVTGNIRMNPPAIRVKPGDQKATAAVAKVLAGLIRNIEVQSRAERAYINAVENAAGCGMGYVVVTTEYSSNDAWDQDIRIRLIRNPFSIMLDPNAQEHDRSDARYAFISESLPLAEFKARFPNKRTVDFEADELAIGEGDHTLSEHWYSNNLVRVAQYWRRDPVEKTLVLMANGDSGFLEDATDELRPELEKMAVSRRTVQAWKVTHTLVSGAEILEKTQDWLGQYIPIAPCWGDEISLGDKTIRHGLTRFLRDPMRVYNYACTAEAELVALQPKVPWLLTQTMISNHERMWRRAHDSAQPYLLYTADPAVQGGRPTREPPPQASQGLTALKLAAVEDMKAVTGIYDASLGQRTNETSGRAINARKQEGSISTYIYPDNLTACVEHVGRILVDLIPKLYTSDRVVRILDETDAEEFVQVNHQQMGEGGQPSILNDLSLGEYEVTVSTGPSFQTRREEAAYAMSDLFKTYPPAAQVLGDMYVKSIDWPFADEAADRLQAIMPPGIVKPKPGQRPRKPPQPSPEKMIEREIEMAKLEGKKAEVSKTQLETEQKRMETAAQLAEIKANADTQRMQARPAMDAAQAQAAFFQRADVAMARLMQVGEQLGMAASALTQAALAQAAPKRVDLILDANGNPIGGVATPVNGSGRPQ